MFLTILRDGDISVEYMYAYVSKSEENACIILRVSDTERALNILNDHGVSIVDEAYDASAVPKYKRRT